jgi:uncharacterized protein (TIGR03000 family)
MSQKSLSLVGMVVLGGAAFLWPGAGRAQFRPPAAGTLPPGYRSSTLPPRYGSSTLPPVPYYDMRGYHPMYYTPPAPPQEVRPNEAPTAPPREVSPNEAPTAPPGPGPYNFEPPAPGNIAVITARVPRDAELRFDGVKTPGTGDERQFKTPPLRPGHHYGYTVEARWQENGRTVTQSRRLPVSAGANVRLVFPLAPAGGAKGPVSPRP